MRANRCGYSSRNESRQPTIGKAFLGICTLIYFALTGIEAVLSAFRLVPAQSISPRSRKTQSSHHGYFHRRLTPCDARQRFQITTDGFAPYRSAIVNTLEDRADFAQLIKVYRATPEGERRCTPAEIVSTEVVLICGDPD